MYLLILGPRNIVTPMGSLGHVCSTIFLSLLGGDDTSTNAGCLSGIVMLPTINCYSAAFGEINDLTDSDITCLAICNGNEFRNMASLFNPLTGQQ
jgi:hypothetical protein